MLRVASFESDETWHGGSPDRVHVNEGSLGLGLSVPANDAQFVWRDVTMDMSGGPWDMRIWVYTDQPQNIGRLYVMARSGPPDGREFTFWPFAGLEAGWNEVVIPKERFVTFRYFGHFSWARVRAWAIKLESNGNGPAAVTVDDVTVEPRHEAPLPPVIMRVNPQPLTPNRTSVTWTTNVPVRSEIEYGLTTTYGVRKSRTGLRTSHELVLARLRPSRLYHCRIRASGDGGSAFSGDFTFMTPPTRPPLSPDPAAQRFGIGIFSVGTAEDLKSAIRTPFNQFHSYFFSTCVDSVTDALRFLDLAQAHGAKVLMGLCTEAPAKGTDASSRFAERVRRLRTHRALLGWYTFDEPEGTRVDPDWVASVYQSVRQADSGHPVMIGSFTLGPSYAYRSALDRAIVDAYPIPYGPPDAILSTIDKARASGKDFEFAFQAFSLELHGWPASGRGPTRYPSQDEMRLMAYLAVIHGAKGLWTYAYSEVQGTPGSEWHWCDLTAVAQELRSLAPLFSAASVANENVAAVDDANIDWTARVYRGKTYLIAANRTASPVSARVRLTDPSSRAVRDLLGGRSIRVAKGEWRDRWPRYGVRVYRIEGSRVRRR